MATVSFSARVAVAQAPIPLDPAQWATWRDILPPDRPAETGFALVEIDGRVYDHARQDLGDLRILDEKNNQIPYIIPDRSTREKPKQWPVKITDLGMAPDQRVSTWLVDLGFRNIPSSRIEFKFAETNFQRHLQIEGSNNREQWAFVKHGEILDVDIGRVKRRNLVLIYDQSRYRYLRIKIFNYDDRPLHLEETRVYGQPQNLLFAFESGRRYRLFYSNHRSFAPRYDLERLADFVKTQDLPVLQLGDEHPLPAIRDPKPETEPPAGYRGWIWAILAVAALVLGYQIYRLAKLTTG